MPGFSWATAAVLRCSTPASDPCRISSHPRGGADRRWSTSSRLPVCGVEQGRPRSRVPARARSRRAAAAEVRTPCAARSINRCARQCRARLRTGAASGVNRAKIVALQWFHVPQINPPVSGASGAAHFAYPCYSMLFNVVQSSGRSGPGDGACGPRAPRLPSVEPDRTRSDLSVASGGLQVKNGQYGPNLSVHDRRQGR
jgi:hypothetical protein